MTAKIKTYSTLADFENVAKRIVAGNKGTRALMQEATIAALAHIHEHGNINVIMPLAGAAMSFGRNLTTAWNGYVAEYAPFLAYNKADLSAAKLRNAKPEEVWTRAEGVKPDAIKVEEAKAKNWWDYKKPSGSNADAEVNVADKVKRFEDSIVKALIAKLAVGADGKPVTIATVTKMVREMNERIEAAVLKGLKDKDAEKASTPPATEKKPRITKAQPAPAVAKAA